MIVVKGNKVITDDLEISAPDIDYVSKIADYIIRNPDLEHVSGDFDAEGGFTLLFPRGFSYETVGLLIFPRGVDYVIVKREKNDYRLRSETGEDWVVFWDNFMCAWCILPARGEVLW